MHARARLLGVSAADAAEALEVVPPGRWWQWLAEVVVRLGPRLAPLQGRGQHVLVVLRVAAHVVDDGRELPLAQRTHRPHLGPLQQTREAELVETRVRHGLVVDVSEADGTRLLVAVRRGAAVHSVQTPGSPLGSLLPAPLAGRGRGRRSFRSRRNKLRCRRALINLDTGTGSVLCILHDYLLVFNSVTGSNYLFVHYLQHFKCT